MKGNKRERPKGSNQWQLSIYAGIDPNTGKKKYFRETFKGSESQADTRLAKLITEISEKRYIPPAKETMEQFFNMWLEHVKTVLKPRTYESYEMIVKRHFIPSFGKVQLDKFSEQHVLDYIKKKLKNGKLDRQGDPTNEPLSARTVFYHYRTLNRALNNAVKWKKIRDNPLRYVDPPKPERKEMLVLNPAQILQFLSTVEKRNDRLYTLYFTAIILGLRRSELLGLKWQDIDFDRRTIQVRRQNQILKNQDSKDIFRHDLKRNNGRLLKMPVVLSEELQRWHEKQNAEKEHEGSLYCDLGLVFCQPNGKPINRGSMDRWSFKKALKEAKLSNIRFHDLRHTTATFLLHCGVHPKIVQEILGDSSIDVVMDTYSHALPTMQDGAVENWDMFFNKEKGGNKSDEVSEPES